MSFKLNVGICKKIAQPDVGALGVSCSVEVALDPSLISMTWPGFLFGSSKPMRPAARQSTMSLLEGRPRATNRLPTERLPGVPTQNARPMRIAMPTVGGSRAAVG